MATVVGGSGSDTLTGNDTQNDSLWGSGGGDTLYGGPSSGGGNDLLDGGTGADAIFGGDGNDTLIGGSGGGSTGADSLYGGTGTDTADYSRFLTALDSLSGASTFSPNSSNMTVSLADGTLSGTASGQGSDILVSIENVLTGSGDDVVTGNSGANLLDGGSGTDRLSGGLGADTLVGGVGIDTLYGGSDGDLVYGGNDGDRLYGNDGIDTLFGEAGNDLIYGDAGNDSLYGGDNSDTLFGGSENDYLDGGTGSNSLYGGAHNDTLVGGASNNFLDGGSGLDIADYSASNAGITIQLDTTIIGGGHATGDTLSGIDGLIGSAYDDTLIGYDGAGADPADIYTNILYGGGGNDLVDGRGSGDLLYGGDGRDTVLAGAGDDTSYGDAGNDLVNGEVGNDLAYGGTDRDTLYGDAGADTLFGDEGDDRLFGGADGDALNGGIGADALSGDAGNDTLYGDAGPDTLFGGTNADLLYSGIGQDVLYGGAGADTIFAGDDEDRIFVGFNAAYTDTLLGSVAAANDVANGEIVDGGGDDGPTDNDTLTVDITGFGWARMDLDYSPGDDEAGLITFYDANGAVVGTLAFSEIENVVIVCFTAGTQIMTTRGPVAVEELGPGDLVLTRDNGPQPLRWVGSRKLSHAELLARPQLQPVRIGAGALHAAGPERSMLVSPQHRVLIEGARAEMYFGESEVLVPAKHLTNLAEVTRALPAEGVTYVHILFDRHEIVQSEGLWTESFQPAERTLNALDSAARAEVLELFPELVADADAYPAARLSLKAHEARVLISD